MRALAIVHQRDAGPGVFAEAFRDRAAELDTWLIAEGADPPGDPAAYDAVLTFGGAMHVDQEDEHPWLAAGEAPAGRAARARHPALRRLPRRPAPLRGGGRQPRRVASEPEIGWPDVEVTDEGAADPLIGPLAPRFEAFGWHSYECRAAGRRRRLAESAVCIQAYRLDSSAWGIQFHAEVSATDAEPGSATTTPTQTPSASASTPKPSAAATRERIEAWNEPGPRPLPPAS